MELFKTSDGLNLAYHTYGQPTNPTILLLHGNSCSAELFKPQFNSIFENYFLIAPDFVGHGGSGQSENEAHYSMNGMAQSITQLVESLEIDQLTVYGVSLGGHVAMEMAPLLSKKLKGIMISGAPPLKIPLNTAECFTDSPVMAKSFVKDLTPQNRTEWADACVYENDNAKKLVMSWIEATEPEFREKFGASLSTAAGVSNEFQIIEEVSFPVAFVQGEHEWLIKPNYFDKIKPINFYKNKVHWISGSAHFPNLENPEDFNQLLKEFALYCFEN
jgi:pimeloyl-ACP methyl ester carboxylesterase